MHFDLKINEKIFKINTSIPNSHNSMFINVEGLHSEQGIIEEAIKNVVINVLTNAKGFSYLHSSPTYSHLSSINKETNFEHCFQVKTDEMKMETILTMLGVTKEQLDDARAYAAMKF